METYLNHPLRYRWEWNSESVGYVTLQGLFMRRCLDRIATVSNTWNMTRIFDQAGGEENCLTNPWMICCSYKIQLQDNLGFECYHAEGWVSLNTFLKMMCYKGRICDWKRGEYFCSNLSWVVILRTYNGVARITIKNFSEAFASLKVLKRR